MTKIIISFIVGAALAISVPALAWQIIGVTQGGTGTGTAPTDGQLLIGKTDGTYAVSTLTAGTNMTITEADGGITLDAAGSANSQAWEKYVTLTSPVDIITPTTTNASIFVSGNATTTGHFEANSTLYVKDSQVGIGVEAPTEPLDVLNNMVISGSNINDAHTQADEIEIDSGGAHTGMSILATTNSNIWFGDASSNTIGRITYNHAADDMWFYSGNAETMRLTSDQKVGIGQQVPEAKFEVNSGSSLYATGIFNGSPGSGTTTLEVYTNGSTQPDDITFGSLGLYGNSSGGAFNSVYINAGATTGQARILFGDLNDSDVGRIAYSNANNDMSFMTQSSNALVLASDQDADFSGKITAEGIEGNINFLIPDAKLGQAANPAARDGGQQRWYLLFDDTTSECAEWQSQMPRTWSTEFTLKADVIYSAASATTGTIAFDVHINALTDGESLESTSFSNPNTAGAITVPGTAGLIDTAVITMGSTNAVAPGDFIAIRLCRDVAADNATGDAEVAALNMYWE